MCHLSPRVTFWNKWSGRGKLGGTGGPRFNWKPVGVGGGGVDKLSLFDCE